MTITVAELYHLAMKVHQVREDSYIQGTGRYGKCYMDAADEVCGQHPWKDLAYFLAISGEGLDTLESMFKKQQSQ